MRNVVSRRPSPGTVIGLIALFIAMAGTAYAASLPRNSVGTKQLRNGSVTALKWAPTELRESRVVVGPGQSGFKLTQCRSGDVAVGLGTRWSNPGNDDLATAYVNYSSAGGFRRGVFARGINHSSSEHDFVVQALCLPLR
jgi:hypothetical protein